MPTTIGTLIAAARYEQEWTQDDLADANTLLAHAVKLLRLHVLDVQFRRDCASNDGEPCYSCRTVAFLGDNFPENAARPTPDAPAGKGGRHER